MLIDNKKNRKLGDILKQNITNNSKLSIISNHFSIYAFAELKKELTKIKELRLLLTVSIFKNYLSGEPEERKFKNQLQQVKIAKECAIWIRDIVKIKELKTAGTIPFNLYHINNNSAIQGSSNFSSVGLDKTFEALAVIKYHELRNDRVLVLAPKKLRENLIL